MLPGSGPLKTGSQTPEKSKASLWSLEKLTCVLSPCSSNTAQAWASGPEKPPPSWEVEVFVGVWARVSPQGDVEGNAGCLCHPEEFCGGGENLILSALAAASASGGGKSKG